MAAHMLTAAPPHSVWSRALSPRPTIASGDTVHMQTQDATGGQLNPSSTVGDYLAIDRERIHALTGPIAIEGAMPGDVLEVKILEVAHIGWGRTSLVPGMVLSTSASAPRRSSTGSRSAIRLTRSHRRLLPCARSVVSWASLRQQLAASAPDRPGPSAATWTSANCILDRPSTCQSLCLARSCPPVTPTPRRATARSASTASSVRLRSSCG